MADNIIYARETDWVSLLDKIRKKGGTVDKMTLPQAMVAVDELPDKVYKDIIEDNFEGTEFSSDIEKLGAGAFYDKWQLRNVNLPNVYLIKPYAFYECDQLMLDKGFEHVSRIERSAFEASCGTELTEERTVGNFPRLERICERGFSGNDKLIIFNAPLLTKIDEKAFYFCRRLEKLNTPNLRELGEYSFAYTKIKFLKIKNKDERSYIGGCAFLFSSLTTLKIDVDDMVLQSSAFTNADTLKYLWIKGGCKFYPFFNEKYFIKEALKDNTSLEDIYYGGTDTKYFGGVTQTVHYGITESQFDNIVRQKGGPLE